jgi:glycosyltransferase involved in cell wall biosynthesis
MQQICANNTRKHSALTPGLSTVLLIPAYQPGRSLIQTVAAIANTRFATIIIVDDGSDSQFSPIFDALRAMDNVRILRHAVNLGKGAALKTGINYALAEYPAITGIVTADADGQHDPRDIAAVARTFAGTPTALVIGSRGFAAEIPWRSRLGNLVTRRAVRFLVGQELSDTQSGLRAIPRSLAARLLRVPASGYEFEFEMLMLARSLGTTVLQPPIRTIYLPGNPTSHFHPLRDSMRIYFVLLRFSLISLTTAGLDNLAFYLLFHASASIPCSLAGARILALAYNYTLVRKAVFHSRRQHRVVLPRYLALGAIYICISYALLTLFSRYLSVGVIPSKILAESLLFIANFATQRDFVFAPPGMRNVSSGNRL